MLTDDEEPRKEVGSFTMKRKIWLILKNAAILFCVVFAVLTLISSIIQLCMGQPTDTNIHVLDRAALCLIGVVTITLVTKIKMKSKVLPFIISYAIAIVIVLAYTWISGFYMEQNPNAYRDIFLNFTVAYILVISALIIIRYIKSKKKRWR